MIGLATAPHRRSATIVAARYSSSSDGSSPRSNQTKISGSAIFSMVAPIFSRSLSSSRRSIRGGSLLSFSITLTKFPETPARPISRSTASGGQVDIRSDGNTEGFAFSSSTPTSVRFFVSFSVASTSCVVCTRVVRFASGAKRMNQSLYMFTDCAMSCFHRSGLSLFTAITCSSLPDLPALPAGKAPTSPEKARSSVYSGPPPPS